MSHNALGIDDGGLYFGDLVALQTVNMSHNCLPALVSSVTTAPRLSRIIASHNRISVVPVHSAWPPTAALRFLDLSYNELTTLPRFGAIESEVAVNLDYNAVEVSLPVPTQARCVTVNTNPVAGVAPDRVGDALVQCSTALRWIEVTESAENVPPAHLVVVLEEVLASGAISPDVDAPHAWLQLATARMRLGEYEKALDAVDRCVGHSRTRLDGLLTRSNVRALDVLGCAGNRGEHVRTVRGVHVCE